MTEMKLAKLLKQNDCYDQNKTTTANEMSKG